MADRELVAADSTAVLGTTGGSGDLLEGLLVIPASTSPGSVTLIDSSESYVVFEGGAVSVSCLVPFYIPINLRSFGSGWKVTTGDDVSVLATGAFT